MRDKREINKYIRRNMSNLPKIYKETYKALALDIIEHIKKKSLLERAVDKSFYEYTNN